MKKESKLRLISGKKDDVSAKGYHWYMIIFEWAWQKTETGIKITDKGGVEFVTKEMYDAIEVGMTWQE